MTIALNAIVIAFALGVLLLAFDAFGCSCELQTHPSFGAQHGVIVTVLPPAADAGPPRFAPRVGHGWWDAERDGGE